MGSGAGVGPAVAELGKTGSAFGVPTAPQNDLVGLDAIVAAALPKGAAGELRSSSGSASTSGSESGDRPGHRHANDGSPYPESVAEKATAKAAEPAVGALSMSLRPKPPSQPIRHDEGDPDEEPEPGPVKPARGKAAAAKGEEGGAGGGKKKLPRPTGAVSCPRCSSMDTKFCYYNNYNVKQPRYFCKGCQRYWTAGGLLRNVPVGAGRRKSKGSAAAAAAGGAGPGGLHGGAMGLPRASKLKGAAPGVGFSPTGASLVGTTRKREPSADGSATEGEDEEKRVTRGSRKSKSAKESAKETGGQGSGSSPTKASGTGNTYGASQDPADMSAMQQQFWKQQGVDMPGGMPFLAQQAQYAYSPQGFAPAAALAGTHWANMAGWNFGFFPVAKSAVPPEQLEAMQSQQGGGAANSAARMQQQQQQQQQMMQHMQWPMWPGQGMQQQAGSSGGSESGRDNMSPHAVAHNPQFGNAMNPDQAHAMMQMNHPYAAAAGNPSALWRSLLLQHYHKEGGGSGPAAKDGASDNNAFQ